MCFLLIVLCRTFPMPRTDDSTRLMDTTTAVNITNRHQLSNIWGTTSLKCTHSCITHKASCESGDRGYPAPPPQESQHYGPVIDGPNNSQQQPYFKYSQCTGRKKALCVCRLYTPWLRKRLQNCHYRSASTTSARIASWRAASMTRITFVDLSVVRPSFFYRQYFRVTELGLQGATGTAQEIS